MHSISIGFVVKSDDNLLEIGQTPIDVLSLGPHACSSFVTNTCFVDALTARKVNQMKL